MPQVNWKPQETARSCRELPLPSTTARGSADVAPSGRFAPSCPRELAPQHQAEESAAMPQACGVLNESTLPSPAAKTETASQRNGASAGADSGACTTIPGAFCWLVKAVAASPMPSVPAAFEPKQASMPGGVFARSMMLPTPAPRTARVPVVIREVAVLETVAVAEALLELERVATELGDAVGSADGRTPFVTFWHPQHLRPLLLTVTVALL